MKILVMAILIVIGLTLVLGAVAFFIFRNKGSKHPFILLSRNGKSGTVIHGVLRVDPQNTAKKQFVFPTLNTFLPIAKPNWYFNNVGYRLIAQDDKGDYSYVNPDMVQKSFKLGLKPEDKELALFRYRENQKRYENPMNKMQAAMLITGFILILIILIGVIYSTYAYVKTSDNFIKITKDMIEGQKIQQSTMTSMKEISLQQTQIIAAMSGKPNNITRQLS